MLCHQATGPSFLSYCEYFKTTYWYLCNSQPWHKDVDLKLKYRAFLVVASNLCSLWGFLRWTERTVKMQKSALPTHIALCAKHWTESACGKCCQLRNWWVCRRWGSSDQSPYTGVAEQRTQLCARTQLITSFFYDQNTLQPVEHTHNDYFDQRNMNCRMRPEQKLRRNAARFK